MRSYVCLMILFLLACHVGLAQPVYLKSDTETLNLCPLVSVYADPAGTRSFDQVRQQTFIPHRQQSFQFGFSKQVFWFRFTLDPGTAPKDRQWYLLWSDGLRDRIDLYVPQPDGSWSVLKGGLMTPAAQKAYKGLFPAYSLGAVTRPQTYYLRLEASESINGLLTLLTYQAYIDSLPGSLAMVWLVIGIQLLRVFYNIILARYVQDSSFRWYVFHTVIVTASVLGSFGVTGNLLGNYPILASFFNVAFFELMPATYTLFIYSLLSVRRHYPKLRPVFFGIVAVSVLQLVCHAFVPRMFLLQANNYLFLFTEAFLIAICSHALIRRVPMNTYLLIPCFITLVPFIFLNLRSLGVIAYDWIYPLIYATNFLEIVALALVLGKIIEAAEQKRLATEKALFTEKVEAEKLVELDALKTRFFTNISHEFRTPLTLLIGPLSDLVQRFPAEELYRIMHRNASRLQTLINQLLDLAKLDNGQLKPDLQPGDLVADIRIRVFAFESLAAANRIQLSLTQDRSAFIAGYDSDKLEKIITNLIANALKFTSAGGSVTVKVSYRDAALVLTVTDTGTGIAPEHLPFIFDRFYQVDASQRRGYEGTGVGLALVRELVRLLDGDIKADSQLGAGTTFTVTLPVQALSGTEPVAEADAVVVPVRPESAEPVMATSFPEEATHQPVVLIVEDNEDLRTYVRSILNPYYRILEATDGQAGLDQARQAVPDLIVTDVMMPVLDGITLCRYLRQDQATSHIPVVMLTARAALDDRLQGLGTGADDYLTKPFVAQELLVRVQNLLARQQVIRAYFREQVIRPAGATAARSIPEPVFTVQQQAFIDELYRQIDLQLENVEFDVEGLAKSLAMSSRTLARKLNALLNMTAGEVIRTYRLRHAAELLKSGLSPSETAYRVGFDNLSYFSRVFREYTGSSPSDYVRQLKEPSGQE
ncbi:ATP-binding protein [Arsenicibacter rosenii]|uniref:histidine kinase n=1 Tax=Arsenicibacter rosenii TaxID=1750698 RepID=A0A1S2VD65_9BACT|nr:ATP-binding protein [Arsenicibacter rosenii]OIN56654.1 hypothetical protein BLX24_23790 [Arsenicibacter rosenii]